MQEGRLPYPAMNRANNEIDQVVRTYDRMASVYDALDAIYEWSWKRRLRADLFRHAVGSRLLDVGVGTGCNMPFYPPGMEVAGIDSSRKMLDKARQRAAELRRPVELREMNLLSLDYPDASFDTISITFVLLCLPDELQEPALSELRRVLKPGGRLLVLDYHRSSKAGTRLWTRAMAPWLKWAFAARFDVDTERHLERVGFGIASRRTYMGDGVTMLVLTSEAGLDAKAA